MPHFYPPDPAPVNQIPREFCYPGRLGLALAPNRAPSRAAGPAGSSEGGGL